MKPSQTPTYSKWWRQLWLTEYIKPLLCVQPTFLFTSSSFCVMIISLFFKTDIIFNSSWEINMWFKKQHDDWWKHIKPVVIHTVAFKCICGVKPWLLTCLCCNLTSSLSYSVRPFFRFLEQLQPTDTESCLNNSICVHAQCAAYSIAIHKTAQAC